MVLQVDKTKMFFSAALLQPCRTPVFFSANALQADKRKMFFSATLLQPCRTPVFFSANGLQADKTKLFFSTTLLQPCRTLMFFSANALQANKTITAHFTTSGHFFKLFLTISFALSYFSVTLLQTYTSVITSIIRLTFKTFILCLRAI